MSLGRHEADHVEQPVGVGAQPQVGGAGGAQGTGDLAALLAGRLDPAPPRIGVVLSGGNVGAARLAELLA